MLIDYKGIEALNSVIEYQSFEEAAKSLHITQSAVSQRIKAIESYYGEPVLIRALPYRLTRLGTELIAHYRKVALLEEDLQQQLIPHALPHISIALNRDSLETWFQDFILEENLFNKILIEVFAADQDHTLDYLKNGIVSACLSTASKPIVGGEVQFLGTMDYLLVATPKFVDQHKKDLLKAPALKFDLNDKLHEKFFDLPSQEFNFHIIPSVQGFKKFVLMGYASALIPKIDIEPELKSKKLIPLFPDKVWQVPLYWHSWTIQSKPYQDFNSSIIRYAKKRLQ